MFYTYILFSPKLDKFYTGSTNDLERRLKDHNRGKTNFTRMGMPWELKYFETFNTKGEAVRREMEIKKQKNRQYILQLINRGGSEHPDTSGGSLVRIQ